MDITNIEQNATKPQKHSCYCVCYRSRFEFTILAVLLSIFVSLSLFGCSRTYHTIGLTEHDINDAEDAARQIREDKIRKGIISREDKFTGRDVDDVIEDWIKEEGKDQLFVGTWQVEIPWSNFYADPQHAEKHLFSPIDTSMPGWEETRLEVRPDYTFILTDPPRGMDYLQDFRGDVTGTWRASYNETDKTLCLYFKAESDLPVDGTGVPARIRSQNLLTLRYNDTSDKNLRLLPNSRGNEGYFPITRPSWKKVIEEKQVCVPENGEQEDQTEPK